MQYRLHADIMRNGISELEEANKLMRESLTLVQSNIDRFGTSELEGETIEALLSMHKILHKHHESLLEIFEEDKECMETLLNSSNNFVEEGVVPSAWR